ncbi:hypothetical protein BKA67DRAFT_128185 [Truncatella angustata]|uniref:Uncharacterized protein n=1 Tax=Truncatella angustata TaxID=152316 RepID=A0A9P8RKZ2_9PEZI|nr:uncharacterized protein BKA67DRAFT_128185 [Truncatella angustata]KAH6645071.1 hypothetical protein BKA67DRAFT_128185 [Truncatella angustata]
MKTTRSTRDRTAVLLLTSLLCATPAAAQTCYAPNGTAVTYSSISPNGTVYQYSTPSSGARLYACPPGADGFATCCAEGDFCHPDGLCYGPNAGQPTVRRQYCTDESWRSSNCSPLCRHDADANSPSSGGAVLTPCMDGKICCGAFQSDCCDDHKGQYAIQGYEVGPGISYNTNSTTTQEVVSATSVTSATASSSSLSQSDASTTLSGGVIAGIVVGASVGLGLICIAAALVYRKRKPIQTQPGEPPKEAWSDTTAIQSYGHNFYGGHSQYELSSATQPGELPSSRLRHELS